MSGAPIGQGRIAEYSETTLFDAGYFYTPYVPLVDTPPIWEDDDHRLVQRATGDYHQQEQCEYFPEEDNFDWRKEGF